MTVRKTTLLVIVFFSVFFSGAASLRSETGSALQALGDAATDKAYRTPAAGPPPADADEGGVKSAGAGNSGFAVKFAASVVSELPLKMDRFLAVADKIWLANPSLLQEWGVVGGNAAAYYNDLIRTMVVSKDQTISENGRLRLRTLPEMKEGANPAGYQNAVSQIFHEMAHAEHDLFVNKGASPGDRDFLRFLNDSVGSWLARNYPEKSSRVRGIAVFEIYGYYRAEAIDTFFSEREELYLENGYNRYQKRCFAGKTIKADALKMSLVDFKKFYSNSPSFDVPYRNLVGPRFVFVNGEDIDLSKPGNPFPREWFGRFWDQFAENFQPPGTRHELMDFLNSSPRETDVLAACRERLWREARAAAP